MNSHIRLIAPCQKGETPTFVKHMEAGLMFLSEFPNALLVFSGYAEILKSAHPLILMTDKLLAVELPRCQGRI
jgi:hypothetical protein